MDIQEWALDVIRCEPNSRSVLSNLVDAEDYLKLGDGYLWPCEPFEFIEMKLGQRLSKCKYNRAGIDS